jgi:glycosyltransferase involved in cell wall biosynthesis
MRILQLGYTPLQHEPPIIALGTTLAEAGHRVICAGHATPLTKGFTRTRSRYYFYRAARPALTFLPRLLRGALRIEPYWRSVFHLGRRWRPELVIAHNYDVLPLAAIVARLVHSPLVYYCTEYTELPRLREFLIGWGFLKLIEPPIVRRCDLVISVDRSRAQLQERDWHRQVDAVILNSPKYDSSFARRAFQLLDKRDGPLRFVYAGLIGKEQCIDKLISAAMAGQFSLDLFGRVAPDFRSEFESSIRSAQSTPGSSVRYRGVLNYRELAEELLAYDVGICLYTTDRINTLFAAPAKLIEYLRAGLAVIATNQPGPKSVLDQAQAGITIDSSDVAVIRASMLYLTDSGRHAVRQLARSGLKAFERTHNYEAQSRDLLHWIDCHQNNAAIAKLARSSCQA